MMEQPRPYRKCKIPSCPYQAAPEEDFCIKHLNEFEIDRKKKNH